MLSPPSRRFRTFIGVVVSKLGLAIAADCAQQVAPAL